MRYYPVLLDCRDRRCCVVGGGAVAARKVKALVAAGAAVTVISPRLTRRLAKLASSCGVIHIARSFNERLLKDFFLVIAATDDVRANHAVSVAATRKGMLVNVVDDPAVSSFIVPSVIAKNGLIVSISTSGAAPCLARNMRLELEKKFIPAYAARLTLMRKARAQLRRSEPDPAKRKRALSRLLAGEERKCRS
jgi:siroheme synthase-like protein